MKAKPMSVEEKAEAVVEMGMVQVTGLDELYRVIDAMVSARNLDVAHVQYARQKGVIYVTRCDHTKRSGDKHVCEGHSFGHVCYHARAGLMMQAKMAGKTLTFGKGYPPHGAVVVKVAGHDNKAAWAMLS